MSYKSVPSNEVFSFNHQAHSLGGGALIDNLSDTAQQSTTQQTTPQDKLSQLFGNNEDDEALFSQLKYERALYRDLRACDTVSKLATCVAHQIKELHFSDYSFIQLSPINNTESFLPIGLLSSYEDKAFGHNALLLQAHPNNLYDRHLSVLYHFVASTEPGLIHGHQYLFIVGDHHRNYYLTLSSAPEASHIISVSHSHNPDNTKHSYQYIHSHKCVLDHMAAIIKEIGCSNFPDFFDGHEQEYATKINPRPLLLLHTLAKKDTSLKEAAKALHLSPDTVNKHVAAAKAAMGTNTIAATLWKAVKRGLISREN